MDENLLSYRIYRTFKKAMLDDPSFKKKVLSLARPNTTIEEIKTQSTIVIVDEEWVNAIEQKLPFLVNAVAEERQFVRSEGEVLPIERVRNVSKESIEDLSKHANYLTHDPAETGGKIIPDRMLVSKKESDYKVYENRFLYTCLVYLNQFLEMRLNEIIAVTGRYDGRSRYVKKVASRTSNIEVELNLHESRLNDPLASNRGGSAEAVRKISGFLATTRMLLSTPLMKDVSTAPLVKPPITKTNIIRFDPNFRETLELHHFLHSYSKKGYEIKEVESTINPFKGRCKEDFALLLFVDSFLTYVYGSEIDGELHTASEEYDAAEQKRAVDELHHNLARAKRELEESRKTPEEYILLIEEGERLLEKALTQKDDQIAEVERAKKSDIQRLSQLFDAGLIEHKKELFEAIDAKDQEIIEARKENEKAMEEARAAAQKRMDEAKELIEQSKAEQAKVEQEKKELQKLLSEEREARSIAEAEIISLRMRGGQKDFEAMTSKEKFAYLDAQKKAFDAYYKKQWSLTKKAILKEALSAPDPKKKNKKGKGFVEESKPLSEETEAIKPTEPDTPNEETKEEQE